MAKKQRNAPVQNLHITLKGHAVNIPPQILDRAEFLFICRELGDLNGQPHAHVGVRLNEPLGKRDVIEMFKAHNAEGGEVDLRAHSNFETALGYHLGLGAKPRCPKESLEFLRAPVGFNPDDYIKARADKRTTNTRRSNERLLSAPLGDLVRAGELHLLAYERATKAVALFRAAEREDLFLQRPDLPRSLPWEYQQREVPFVFDEHEKRIHLWYWSREASVGKSTFARSLCERFRACLYDPALGTFSEQHHRSQLLIIDALRPSTSQWGPIESLTDGLPQKTLYVSGGRRPATR